MGFIFKMSVPCLLVASGDMNRDQFEIVCLPRLGTWWIRDCWLIMKNHLWRQRSKFFVVSVVSWTNPSFYGFHRENGSWNFLEVFEREEGKQRSSHCWIPERLNWPIEVDTRRDCTLENFFFAFRLSSDVSPTERKEYELISWRKNYFEDLDIYQTSSSYLSILLHSLSVYTNPPNFLKHSNL